MKNIKNRWMSHYDYNDESASELDWFYHLTGGQTHTDFFLSDLLTK